GHRARHAYGIGLISVLQTRATGSATKARKAKTMSILDKDTESKAKQEEMNTDAIWHEFITRILPEALQAHALIKFAEERESTPRIKKSLARHTATLAALKLSAD